MIRFQDRTTDQVLQPETEELTELMIWVVNEVDCDDVQSDIFSELDGPIHWMIVFASL